MDAVATVGDQTDQREISVTGSTGYTSSVRTGKVAKSAGTRQVTSKYMQAAMAPPTGHRHDVSGRDAYHLRSGASMGYAQISATPATAVHAGRSLHLTATMKPSGILTSRSVAVRDPHHCPGVSPGAGNTTVTAGSSALPFQLSSAFDAAAQERRKEQLAKYKLEKQAARAGLSASVAAPLGPAANAIGALAAPRVPALALGILREGAQASGDGNRSARNGGVYGGLGGSAAMLARGGQIQSVRPPASARAAAPAPPGANTRANGAAANMAKAPPVPRIPAMPPPGIVEQQLKMAVNSPLPKDEVWEAAQVALPADAFEEGAAGTAAAKTPSSRITKSPRVTAAGGTWAAPSQALAMAPPPPPGVATQSQQPSASVPALSHRGMPAGSQAVAPSAAGGMAADALGGRLASNVEASTSDTGGRSIRDQIKMAKLQELQWRVLKVKVEAAARTRMDKGQRQLAACSLLLVDMMAQSAANSAALATSDVLKRTHHVITTQLPLLQQWKELQDTHGPATREVLTALQNAMTSLPLVNGAALGMGGGDIAQAMPQLRRAIANGLGSLQSAEVAMAMLLHGVNPRASGGGSMAEARAGQGQQGQGGVTAMATLLPQLYDTLRVEVSNLRSLLTGLNTLASQLDEAACLRVRTAAAVLAGAPAQDGLWRDAGPSGLATGVPGLAAWALTAGDGSTADPSVLMDNALAMLGLGIGDA